MSGSGCVSGCFGAIFFSVSAGISFNDDAMVISQTIWPYQKIPFISMNSEEQRAETKCGSP